MFQQLGEAEISVDESNVIAQAQGFGLRDQALAIGLPFVALDQGVNLTGGLFSYLIPTATDVCDIETVILESGEGMGPFGARGIGEPPIGPPAPALANAIHDALGIRLTELPMTPERVLRELGVIGD